MTQVLVTGAAGFIGSHLVEFLKSKGHWVRGVDIKKPEFGESAADEFFQMDLRNLNSCSWITEGIDEVYHLAANMGGIGFISSVHADIMIDNAQINANLAKAVIKRNIQKVFFSSSACIYPKFLQDAVHSQPLYEHDAYPAYPDSAYGWEKLFAEELWKSVAKDYGVGVRIARYHNIYGPMGTYKGGREKSPAAICRKVSEALDGGSIEIWGDGRQRRSYCYIDDCVEGTYRLMQSDYAEPVNIGSDQSVSIDELVDIACAIAGKTLTKVHLPHEVQGVRGRCSNNALVKKVLGWEPSTSLWIGVKKTYEWIDKQLHS